MLKPGGACGIHSGLGLGGKNVHPSAGAPILFIYKNNENLRLCAQVLNNLTLKPVPVALN